MQFRPNVPDLPHVTERARRDIAGSAGVITADGWKYVALEGQPFAMFDLNRDPYELENLAFRRVFPAQRQRLQGLLARWIADTGDRFPLP